MIGSGGVGNTRIALAAAQDVAQSFADGANFVDFSPLTDPAQVAMTVAAAMWPPACLFNNQGVSGTSFAVFPLGRVRSRLHITRPFRGRAAVRTRLKSSPTALSLQAPPSSCLLVWGPFSLQFKPPRDPVGELYGKCMGRVAGSDRASAVRWELPMQPACPSRSRDGTGDRSPGSGSFAGHARIVEVGQPNTLSGS